MAATLPTLLLAWPLLAAAAAPDSTGGAGAPADTARSAPRIVRRFPAIEVRAPLHDLRSSQVVHPITLEALRTLPVDDLAGAVALQAGVVVQGEELHVRGGRAGDLAVRLDGQGLNEPLRARPLDVPVLALRSADLVSGAPDARYGGGLAGVLDLRTLDPGERPEAIARWSGDGGGVAGYDRGSLVVRGPLPRTGLGAVVAADASFDDTALPDLRTRTQRTWAGIPIGWRAENRMSALVKLAPRAEPQGFAAQVLLGRQVHEPYDPQWSLDGWTYIPADPKNAPIFSPVPLPGYQRYKAPDHLAITDDRSLAASVRTSVARPGRRLTLGADWLRTRTATGVGGAGGSAAAVVRPRFGNPGDADLFHVLWGDDPLHRESGADVWALRAEGEAVTRRAGTVQAGAALTYEEVRMQEADWFPTGWSSSGAEVLATPLDTVRAYHAWAPGANAWVQERWESGGMILNAGLRAEYWTAGPQAREQTLPGDGAGIVTLSPRLGIAYPVSVRDVFSLAYVRLSQPPDRDVLYDRRTQVGNRQPLGNPALRPATVISYEAAVKHVFDPTWAMQLSVFFRDLYGQVGARWFQGASGAGNAEFTNDDEGQAVGVEWSLLHEGGTRGRLEVHYTWMQSWGNESRSEGDPYGGLRDADATLVADTPLSWDQRHALHASAAWRPVPALELAWSEALGSGMPWTPKPVRQPFTDYGLVNSRRLAFSECTNLDARWAPRRLRGIALGLRARNLFDRRGDRLATLDGYPNPFINTQYDDYGAYRTVTGLDGGGYLVQPASGSPYWVPVHDARLATPARTGRADVEWRW